MDWIINKDDIVLVTGANGFIGGKVVETLMSYGFSRVRGLVRSTGTRATLEAIHKSHPDALELVVGNLLSPEDCRRMAAGVRLVIHLAAGMDKSFAGCFLNSVVTTRNLIEALLDQGALRRFVNVSSFAVYNNDALRRHALLDETCPVETDHMARHDAYCFGKAKQDELVAEYGVKRGLRYVIMRPGAVYGPGVRQRITPRVGIDTFGIFLHLGGSNQIPLAYVDNCAEALVCGGLAPGIDGEVFNIVDDDLPSSRSFLREYKRQVRPFRSLFLPYWLCYLMCLSWEKYAKWSRGQLPPVFNRKRCSAYWKGNRYSNRKLKERTGWQPRISYTQALPGYYAHLRNLGGTQ